MPKRRAPDTEDAMRFAAMAAMRTLPPLAGPRTKPEPVTLADEPGLEEAIRCAGLGDYATAVVEHFNGCLTLFERGHVLALHDCALFCIYYDLPFPPFVRYHLGTLLAHERMGDGLPWPAALRRKRPAVRRTSNPRGGLAVTNPSATYTPIADAIEAVGPNGRRRGRHARPVVRQRELEQQAKRLLVFWACKAAGLSNENAFDTAARIIGKLADERPDVLDPVGPARVRDAYLQREELFQVFPFFFADDASVDDVAWIRARTKQLLKECRKPPPL